MKLRFLVFFDFFSNIGYNQGNLYYHMSIMAQNTANIQGQDQENAEKAKGSKKRNLVAEFITPFMETDYPTRMVGYFMIL